MRMAHQAATKQDLAELEQRINSKFDAVDAKFDGMRQFVRDVETKLLKAFYHFAESHQKRLNMPPAA